MYSYIRNTILASSNSIQRLLKSMINNKGNFKKVGLIVSHLLPIRKNTICFYSFSGQYNDNPKYISEAVHKLDPTIRIIWGVSENSKSSFPEYVEQIPIYSIKWFLTIGCVAVIIDNYCCCSRKIFAPIVRRKKQLYITTWHGTPLKHIALDDKNSRYKQNEAKIPVRDFQLAGCKYTADILSTAFTHKPVDVCLSGTPRNDCLVKPSLANKAILLKKLNIPSEKKVLLYAPTFRDDIEWSGLNQVRSLNINSIKTALKMRFGGDWVVVFRVHHAVISILEEDSQVTNNKFICGNIGDDMAEYLICTDVLVTDYSGSLFDFALTGRPCFLYVPDIDQYNKERGTYISLDELPYDKCRNTEDLEKAIMNFDSFSYNSKISDFQDKIGNVEDGCASERVAKSVISFVYSGRKELDKA